LENNLRLSHGILSVRLSIRLAYSCIFHPCIFDRITFSTHAVTHFQSPLPAANTVSEKAESLLSRCPQQAFTYQDKGQDFSTLHGVRL